MIIKDELLLVVDENNRPLSPLPRQTVHSKGYWHRTAHVWIINDKKEVLCQQRSLLKDSNPGKWEPFFGGHLGPRDDYSETAIKELQEELGLRVSLPDLKQYDVYKAENAHEFEGLFILQWQGIISDLILEKDEINKVRLFDIKMLERLIIADQNQNWTRIGYEAGMLNYLKGSGNTVQFLP